MTDIADIFGPTSTTPNTSSLYASDMETSMGKEDFLTLLVAQLENQDPMNPDNPTEFTAQLAQFSSLEQLFTMNDSLEGLTAAQQQSDRFATMNLIDKPVSYMDSNFTFNADPVTIGYQLDGTAASVTLSIQDEAGTTVATLHPTEMSEGNHFIEWDGTNTDGELVEPGKYSIALQASAQGEDSSVAVSPLVQSIVTGVDFSNESGEAVIRTATGAEFGSDAILQVFTNQTSSANSESSTTENNSEGGGSATENFLFDTAGKAVSSSITKSAPTDEERIAQDQLEYYLAA